MTNGPLVSIVIPCFNQAHYLRDSVGSAIAQTYPHVEIVVVDDGSTDATAEVAASFGGRVRLVSQQNAGLSAARNTGILSSRGSVICLLDADDLLHPTCVEERLKPFQDDPRVGMVAGACRFVDGDLRPLPDALQPHGKPNPDRPGIFIREAWSPTPGLMVRRRAFELCGMFDPLLTGAEDFDFQIRATCLFRHAYLERPLADYRNPPGSLSRDYARHFNGLVQALTKNRAYAKNRLAYAWHAAIGLLIHTSDGVFGRVRKELGFRGALRTAIALARSRPVVAPLFVGWLARSAWFRVGRRLRLIPDPWRTERP